MREEFWSNNLNFEDHLQKLTVDGRMDVQTSEVDAKLEPISVGP
jgi:hypothetical protein